MPTVRNDFPWPDLKKKKSSPPSVERMENSTRHLNIRRAHKSAANANREESARFTIFPFNYRIPERMVMDGNRIDDRIFPPYVTSPITSG